MQRKLLLLLAISLFFGCGQQEPFSAGEHYVRLLKKQPTTAGKLQVVEFFSYGCPHCNEFEPTWQQWKSQQPEDVEVKSIPVVFGRQSWHSLAKAYYAIEVLGGSGAAHSAIFSAIHQPGEVSAEPGSLADIVAAVGVDRDAFLNAMNSSVVEEKLREAEAVTRAYQIMAVPTVAVNGKYLISTDWIQSFSDITDAIDFLLTKERK